MRYKILVNKRFVIPDALLAERVEQNIGKSASFDFTLRNKGPT